MNVHPSATRLLEQETRALLTRLSLVRPFVLQETSVAAAALSPAALAGIEDHLSAGRRDVGRRGEEFLRWLTGPGAAAPAAEQQRRFWTLRIAFQNALSQFDLFSEVITQRSETENGVMLSGLDVAAAEALRLPGGLVTGRQWCARCTAAWAGRSAGCVPGCPAAGTNPVAIIRIPRERIIGFGVASSLVHEVGHQGAALLGLVGSLRTDVRRHTGGGRLRAAWRRWDFWMSEIVADYWAVGRIGIGSTLGLIALVSLPRGFVFRPADDDPHPVPWIRVLLSCAIGDRLYPDPQWRRLAAVWRRLYPADGLSPALARMLAELEETMPELVTLLVRHRSPALRGSRLGAVLRNPNVSPDALLRRFRAEGPDPDRLANLPPTQAFALIGQARAAGLLGAADEARVLRRLIAHWAVASTLATARAAVRPAEVPMFVGQPTIWADPPSRTDYHLSLAI